MIVIKTVDKKITSMCTLIGSETFVSGSLSFPEVETARYLTPSCIVLLDDDALQNLRLFIKKYEVVI